MDLMANDEAHSPGGRAPTLAEIDAFAARAHGAQVDKAGVPYIHHLRAVSHGVAPFGEHLAMAGLLHDCLEDTDTTVGDLRGLGVPERVIELVLAVTHSPGEDYGERLRRIARDSDAARLKIADNAHNTRPDRLAALPSAQRARLAAKYTDVPTILWAAVPSADVAAILARVNPSLLPHSAGPD